MIDRGAILTEVLNRNAVRRQAWLPSLNIREECQRALAIAIDREVRALAERPAHRMALDRIGQEVQAELFRTHGVTGDSWAGRYAVGHVVARRSMAYLRGVYGSSVPPAGPRHPILYGGRAAASYAGSSQGRRRDFKGLSDGEPGA